MVSAAVRQRRRAFPRGNPLNVLAAIFMLLLVVWSHVVFHQSAVVELPQRGSTSTILPRGRVSRHQTGTPDQWTSVEPLNASTTTHGSLSPATAEQWPTSAKHGSSESRIVIRSDNAMQTVATERPEVVETAAAKTVSGVDNVNDDVNLTDTGAGHDPQPARRQISRDLDGLADRKWRKSRLLTVADNQSLASTPTLPSATSSPRLVGWLAFYDSSTSLYKYER